VLGHRRIPSSLGALALITASALSGACSSRTCEPLPTIDGPEDPALLQRLRGALILSDRSRELRILSLPGRTERTLHLDEPSWSHTAIDALGRLAYLVRRPGSYELRVASLRGDRSACSSSATASSSPGRGRAVGHDGKLAFVYALRAEKGRTSTPELEILDLDAARERRPSRWRAAASRAGFLTDAGSRWRATAACSSWTPCSTTVRCSRSRARPCPGPHGFPMLVDGWSGSGSGTGVVRIDKPARSPFPSSCRASGTRCSAGPTRISPL
jgi:hypothetical protein